VPEFLHVLFNLVVKHSPEKRRRKKSGENSGFEVTLKKNYLLHTRAFNTCTMSTHTDKRSLLAFIVHALIFCPRFSQKQSAKWAKKNTGKCFTTKLKSTRKNSGTFEE